MDVNSNSAIHTAPLQLVGSGDVDGQVILFALSLSKTETANEVVTAELQDLARKNALLREYNALHVKYAQQVDAAEGQLEETVNDTQLQITENGRQWDELGRDADALKGRIYHTKVPTHEPERTQVLNQIAAWNAERDALIEQQGQLDIQNAKLTEKMEALEAGSATNPHVVELMGENLGLNEVLDELAGTLGVRPTFTTMDEAENSVQAVADVINRFAVEVDAKRESVQRTSVMLTRSLQDLGMVVQLLQQTGQQAIEDIVDRVNANQQAANQQAREFAAQALEDNTAREAIEALKSHDELKTQLGIPSNVSSVVTAQLSPVQQEELGRQLQEWLTELRQDEADGTATVSGGERALQQEAKRMRV